MKSFLKMKSHVMKFFPVLALAAALAPVIARAAWLDGFACRRQIEVDCSKIDAPLTNFPALVRLTTNNFDFAKARPDGFDVRFAAADGQTLIAHERERHDTAAEAAEYWVKLPLVAADSNTVFYMYYGCPSAADGADATNVWDAHFAGVWHKNDLTTGSVKDSTTNANNAAKRAANEPVEADGKIGKAQAYDGADDSVDAGTPAVLNLGTGDFTLSFWLKTAVCANWKAVLSKNEVGSTATGWSVYLHQTTGQIRFNMNAAYGTPAGASDLTDGNWHHIAIVRTGAVNRFYEDGIDIGTIAGSANSVDNNNKLRIGVSYNANDNWNGVIDEVRVSKSAHSEAEVQADYHAGKGALLVDGPEESHPAGYFISEFF